MQNRVVGLVVIGIAALIGFVVFSFNQALTYIVSDSCTHGSDCPMGEVIDFQTNVGIGVLLFVVLIGAYFIFFVKDAVVVRDVKQVKPVKVTRESYQKVMAELAGDESLVFGKLIDADGSFFQSDLVDKTGFTKVKVTRILDKLEGRGLIERKRRGMTNVVILKRQ